MQYVGRHTCGMHLECNSLEGCECFTFGHMSYAFEIASKTGEMHLNALAVQQSRGSIARSKTQLKWCREQTLNALEIQSPKSNGLKCNSGKLGNAHTVMKVICPNVNRIIYPMTCKLFNFLFNTKPLQ